MSRGPRDGNRGRHRYFTDKDALQLSFAGLALHE